jgi:hypothetical protein
MSKNSLTLLVNFFLFTSLFLTAANFSFGQQENLENEEAPPPPLIVLTKTESEQLKAENDFKQRTVLCLEIAGNYLQRAEGSIGSSEFQTALSQLGGYQASIENGLNFLQKNNSNDSKKIRDNLRRLEMALRAHAPRLETIRRSTPAEFGIYLKSIVEFTRDARSRALSAFFSDTVLAGDADKLQTSN